MSNRLGIAVFLTICFISNFMGLYMIIFPIMSEFYDSIKKASGGTALAVFLTIVPLYLIISYIIEKLGIIQEKSISSGEK